MFIRMLGTLLALWLATTPAIAGTKSVCRGTTAHGSLENGCQLPANGSNFTAYSVLAKPLGRTYVHCIVASIVKEAYGSLAVSFPKTQFVYGETGFEHGGKFRPHKTHQNGLSVDFFVPVLDQKGVSVPLPTSVLNKWGYAIDFDSKGQYKNLTIDFEAIAAHILALYKAARAHGVNLKRVIFDPQLQPFLHRTRAWPELKDKVVFSKKQAWVRHDDHYHVDFDIPCESIK